MGSKTIRFYFGRLMQEVQPNGTPKYYCFITAHTLMITMANCDHSAKAKCTEKGTPCRPWVILSWPTSCCAPGSIAGWLWARRGDIDYIGQLDDDLVDLIATIHPEHTNATMILIGFSDGGAFGDSTETSSIDTS